MAAAPRGLLGTSTRDPAVIAMFDELSGQYDFFNRVVTLNLDLLWRSRLVRECPKAQRALDFGCGTGDLMVRLLERGKAQQVVGADITPGMLKRARQILAGVQALQNARLARADGEMLPFAARSFDLVVSAFVMRNVGDRASAYREIARVLKPGGSFVQLELAMPKGGLFRVLYLGFFTRLMPFVAGKVHGDRAPYQYLADSLARWPLPEGTAEELRTAGFQETRFRMLSNGIVAIHVARMAT
jgi:demethylmenaquinone methyltransferase/2-methoxy-6-polyprenyl-1,4-benzoquinol methylase